MLCGCGNRGCFEQYASGSRTGPRDPGAARAGSLLAEDLLERAGGDPDAITGPLITEAAQDGDPFAIEQLGVAGPLARRGHRVARPRCSTRRWS